MSVVINDIRLPDTLYEGQEISGEVDVEVISGMTVRVVLTTVWDGEETVWSWQPPPWTTSLIVGGVYMPAQDAVLNFKAQYLDMSGEPWVWVTTDEKNHTITLGEPQVGTSITINAPASVTQGVTFNVSGRLTRDDTGEGIAGMTIYIHYNGSALGGIAGGMGTTDADGYYSVDGQIDQKGSWMLQADFQGATVGGLTMAPSSATRWIGMGFESFIPILILGGLVLLAMQKK